MNNKFFVTSYLYMKNFEYIFGNITSNFKRLAKNRGWENIQCPIGFEINEESNEVIEKGFFGKRNTVIKTRYQFILIFERELEEKSLMFWRGFSLGGWKNY